MATSSDDLLRRYRSGEFLSHLTARPAPGLGDRVAQALDAVGITKQRVAAVAAVVGIDDCGCEQRQQWLNRVGHAVGIGTPNRT